jgi:hypothetical protein
MTQKPGVSAITVMPAKAGEQSNIREVGNMYRNNRKASGTKIDIYRVDIDNNSTVNNHKPRSRKKQGWTPARAGMLGWECNFVCVRVGLVSSV